MADIFEAIADPSRRLLLELLIKSASGGGELSVSDLVAKSGMGQSTVSKHLKVLRDAKLVDVRQVGQKSFYRVTPNPLSTVSKWVAKISPMAEPGTQESAESSTALPEWVSKLVSESGEWLSNRLRPDIDARELGVKFGRALAEARHEAASGAKDFSAIAKSRIDEFLAELKRDESDDQVKP